MKKQLFSILLSLATVGPMVANEFYTHPALPYLANIGQAVVVFTITIFLVVFVALVLGEDTKAAEARRAKSRQTGGFRHPYVALVQTLVFAAMGWWWLFAGCAFMTLWSWSEGLRAEEEAKVPATV